MKSLAIALCFLSISVFSQERKIEIDRQHIGPVTVEHSIKILPDEVDTFKYVIITYQDERFKVLISSESLIFTNNTDLQEFINDLKDAHASLENKSDVLTWRKKQYVIEKTDWSRKLFINGDRKSYFSINKSNTLKLLTWLEANKL